MPENGTATAERGLVEYETDHGKIKLSPGIIRKYLVSGSGNVTDQEVMMFQALCRYQRLNPFLREAYLVKYGDQPATILTGKDAFTKRAEKNTSFDGSEAGIIVITVGGSMIERNGSMVLEGEKIVGGWAKIHRKDRTHPTYVTVAFDEYVGKKKDGTANRQWSEKPATMIRKVALVQALREAFPADFQGMYDEAEMSHVDGSALPKAPVEEAPAVQTQAQTQAPENDVKALRERIVSMAPPEQREAVAKAVAGLTTLSTLEKYAAKMFPPKKDEDTVVASDAEVIDEKPEQQEIF